MAFTVKGGVYPTMITPYRDGKIDLEAVEALTEWYWKEGCDGIFAACQSSEIMFLSLEERVMLTRTVIAKAKALAKADKTREPMMIVASGHVSEDFETQVEELRAIAAEGPDALILVTNRMDVDNTCEDRWIEETERLVSALPADMPLGVYECPLPYKRLLTERMIKWCADSGRFYFLKDTCCDAPTIRKRTRICEGSNLKIFNANTQTLLESMRDGAYGFCGVFANIHPRLYSKLLEDLYAENAEMLQAYLSVSELIVKYTYPCCAKYYLDKYEGVSMTYSARSVDDSGFTDYQKECVDQFALMDKAAMQWFFKE